MEIPAQKMRCDEAQDPKFHMSTPVRTRAIQLSPPE
jgi:hypothetical protein